MIRRRILFWLRVAVWASVAAAIALFAFDRDVGAWPALLPLVSFGLTIAARHVPLPRAWDDRHPPRFAGCIACESWAALTGVEVVPPLRDLDELEADSPATTE